MFELPGRICPDWVLESASGPPQGEVVVPPGSNTASWVSWRLPLGCTGGLSTPEHLEHGTGQPGCCHTPRTAGSVAVLRSSVTEVGDQGHKMVPLTWLLKGSVRDIEHAVYSLVVCYLRSWVIFFSYNTFNCVMNVGDQLKTCLLEWAWS